MKRILAYITLAIIFMLITFFGLGPVLFADGSGWERLSTLLVVLALYGIVALAFYYTRKHRFK
jgi:hypothetical protein